MRKDLSHLDECRLQPHELPPGYTNHHNEAGAMWIRSRTTGDRMKVIFSTGYGWDHVSVSIKHRCPSWLEMEQIRRLFFEPEEAVMQYHAPLSEYVDGSDPRSGCKFCLHLWRPTRGPEIPTPPKWMVGGMTPAEAEEAMQKAVP